MVDNFKLFYLNIAGTVTKCANVNFTSNDGHIVDRVDFTYHADHLNAKYGIDPAQLPLNNQPYKMQCHKALPAFVDDILPDNWGKKVISRMYDIPHPTDQELLKHIGQSTIGAIQFSDGSKSPSFNEGCDIKYLEQLEKIANKLDNEELIEGEIELVKLSLFSQGSSVGGARPKVLVHNKTHAYIAKFAKTDDKFDYAKVEHACLTLIESIGVEVAQSEWIASPINQDENIFLTTRFDVPVRGMRYHLITVNGLLKNTETQKDIFSASYEDILTLISLYSYQPKLDKKQLFVQMLFNKAFNNTDDHLRNFSFLADNKGWRLSPVYDVVPSLTLGKYHQLKFNYSDILPTHHKAAKHHKKFGMTLFEAENIILAITNALNGWETHFSKAGVSNMDIKILSKIIKK